MTPRERLLSALTHRVPDRVPLDLWARPEVWRKLEEHFATDQAGVERRLGLDIVSAGLGMDESAFLARTNGELTGDCPYAGGRYIFHPDGTFEDLWGVRRRVGRDGKYVEWVKGPLSDRPDLAGYEFPPVAWLKPASSIQARVDKLKQEYAVCGGITNPFKSAWELRGMENFLADFLEEPEFAAALYDQIYAFQTERARRLAQAGVDILTITGDVAMQTGTLMSPAVWRQFDKPRLAQMLREVKKVKADIHVYFHSDGNVEAIVPDLIEAGMDILNPVQPECMDPARIKRLYGDRLTLWGTGSLQKTLPFGTEQEVRAEVRDRIQVCGKNGGLVLMPSNVVGFDVPLANLLAYYDEALTYRAEGSTA